MTTTRNFKATIDVRHVIPRERHPLIFSTFDHLDAGEALLLVEAATIRSRSSISSKPNRKASSGTTCRPALMSWQVRIGKPLPDGVSAPVGGCGCNH